MQLPTAAQPATNPITAKKVIPQLAAKNASNDTDPRYIDLPEVSDLRASGIKSTQGSSRNMTVTSSSSNPFGRGC
jgi:hypothetical protein